MHNTLRRDAKWVPELFRPTCAEPILRRNPYEAFRRKNCNEGIATTFLVSSEGGITSQFAPHDCLWGGMLLPHMNICALK